MLHHISLGVTNLQRSPGLRPHYGKNYYAAFVVDPDGHRIEAVINTAEGSA
jgi:hypothetical protein